MSLKASGLTTENNRLYAAENTYNNTMVPQFEALLASYGLVEPLTLAQIQGLTLKQLGQLLEAIASIDAAIGKEIGSRTFEANLLALGYTTAQAAINDVPAHFTGQAAATVANTLTETAALLATLDTLVDAGDMLNRLNKIVTIKDTLKSVCTTVAQV